MKTCKASLYRLAYTLDSQQENPAFLGWVVEFDFISQMRQCFEQKHMFEFVKEDGTYAGTQWSVSQFIDFDQDSFKTKDDA